MSDACHRFVTFCRQMRVFCAQRWHFAAETHWRSSLREQQTRANKRQSADKVMTIFSPPLTKLAAAIRLVMREKTNVYLEETENQRGMGRALSVRILRLQRG